MDLSTLMPQQLQIVKTLDRPLFVSAGAGSGKTFTAWPVPWRAADPF